MWDKASGQEEAVREQVRGHRSIVPWQVNQPLGSQSVDSVPADSQVVRESYSTESSQRRAGMHWLLIVGATAAAVCYE